MKILKHSPGQVPNVELVGNIDENSDFTLIDVEGDELHVDCYEVSRINSVGIRKWIIYFDSLHKKGIKIFFYRISTALVDQFNNIRNFGAGGQVISASAPFHCDACGKMSLLEKFKKELQTVNFNTVVLPCPHCGKTALKFDDAPEEYFFFWR